MQTDGMRRRDVLRSAGVFATALVAGKAVIFGPGNAWAMAPTSLDPHAAQTLMVMAYDLFPHERLGSEYYAAVVVSLDKDAGSDAALRTLLTNGVARLDSSHGMPFSELSEGQRHGGAEKHRDHRVLHHHAHEDHQRAVRQSASSIRCSAMAGLRSNTAAISTAALTTSAGYRTS